MRRPVTKSMLVVFTVITVLVSGDHLGLANSSAPQTTAPGIRTGERHPRDEYRVRSPQTPLQRVDASRTETHEALARFDLAEQVGAFGRQEGPQHQLFGEIAAVHVDNTGRVYVLDKSFQNVRVFASDGTHLATVGRPGQGPGEFTAATAMTVDPDSGSVHVADNARRLQLFSWVADGSAPRLAYRSSVALSLVPLDMCWIGQLLVAHAITFVTREALQEDASNTATVLHAVDAAGVVTSSFGRVYDSPNAMMNVRNSRGSLTCDRNGASAYLTPTANLGETHAFGLSGTPQWTLGYSDFRPMDLFSISEPRRGVSMGVPPDGYHAVVSSGLIDDKCLLIQMALVAPADSGDRTTLSLESYIIATATGEAAFVGNDLPWIVASAGPYFVTREDKPNPEFIVFKATRVDER